MVLGAAGCQQETTMTIPPPVTQTVIPTRAEDVRPLNEGERAPSATLSRPDGQPVTLSAAYSTKPSILIFYRGGWCPYCNTHLGQIAKAEADLVQLGYQVLAISPDQPEALRASVDKGGYTYQLLSDSDMVLTRAFGLAFRVDDPTVEKYRGFGIDLDKASGRNHHLLPVPAVYIVDTQGVIRFAHWDADYKKRLEPADLIAAARRIVGR
jgi:peroxiredoxin